MLDAVVESNVGCTTNGELAGGRCAQRQTARLKR